MANKCEHKWVDIEDGTNDQFCVKCRRFTMRNQMSLPNLTNMEIKINPPDLSAIANAIDRDLKRKMKTNG